MKEDGKVVQLQPHKGIRSRSQNRKLMERCREHALTHLKSLLQRMFDNADDTLFAMADNAESNTEQSMYFDSMRIVRLNRHDIESRFYRNIEAGFERFWESDSELTRENESPGLYFDDLSLAMITLTNKLKQHYSQEVNAIEQRLDEITDGIHIIDDNNPLGPKFICNAFDEATRSLDTILKIKLIIYKLFDMQMMADVGHLFDTINNEFINAGVLPRIKTRIRYQSTVNQSGSKEKVDVEQGSITDDDSGDIDSHYLASLHKLITPPPGTLPDHDAASTNPIGLDKLITTLTALQHASTPAAASSTGSNSRMIRAAMQGSLDQMANDSSSLDSIDNDIIDIVAMMFDFILDDPNLPDQARSIIGRLQIPMIKVALIDKSFFSDRTHPARKLLNQLAAAGLTLDNRANIDLRLLEKMSSIVNRILDEFKNDIHLFEVLCADLENFEQLRRIEEKTGLSEARRQFAAQEQIELARSWVRETLKDALADTRLPVNILRIIMGPWHDVMTQTYLNQGDKSTLWKNQLRFVDVLIWSVQPKKIRVDRKKLSRVVRHLMDTLRSGLEAIDYPADKIAQIFKAVEPYHHASLHGMPEDDTHAKSTPDSGASLYLFEDGMDPGMRNDVEEEEPTLLNLEQRKLRQTIEQMEQKFATLDELDTVLGISRLNSGIPAETENDFDQVITRDIAMAGWDTQQQDSQTDVTEDDYLKLARQLEIGSWLEFTGTRYNKMRARLAWINKVREEYAFTNWKYDVLAEMTVHDLARALRQGQARIIDEVPLLDRTLNAVMHNLSDRIH
jgi:hypothetical protein